GTIFIFKEDYTTCVSVSVCVCVCVAILSALTNLQEKIRKLELERGRTERSLHSLEKETSHTHTLRDRHKPTHTHTLRDTHKPTDTHERETSNQSEPNQGVRRDNFPKYVSVLFESKPMLFLPPVSPSLSVSLSPSVPSVLVTQLAAAESRCKLLDRQLEYMRKMVRNAEADRTTLLKRQVSLEMTRSAAPAPDSAHQAQLEKLELLEQEYQRLTRTQNHAEVHTQTNFHPS
uniref:Cep57 centrosome localisation domain-containing protein n=1 Tax=Hucho hucho TaxID=62062 RepID=A0A4W5LJ07_9TELE